MDLSQREGLAYLSNLELKRDPSLDGQIDLAIARGWNEHTIDDLGAARAHIADLRYKAALWDLQSENRQRYIEIFAGVLAELRARPWNESWHWIDALDQFEDAMKRRLAL